MDQSVEGGNKFSFGHMEFDGFALHVLICGTRLKLRCGQRCIRRDHQYMNDC